MIDEGYFLSLYSQDARAVLRYLHHRIAAPEARVTRSRQALVTKLSKELTEVKAPFATKSARLVVQQQLNRRLCARIRELSAHNSVSREV